MSVFLVLEQHSNIFGNRLFLRIFLAVYFRKLLPFFQQCRFRILFCIPRKDSCSADKVPWKPCTGRTSFAFPFPFYKNIKKFLVRLTLIYQRSEFEVKPDSIQQKLNPPSLTTVLRLLCKNKSLCGV